MNANIRPAVRFKEMIIKKFSVRMHMFVILTAVITFGLVFSKILLLSGITDILIRYTAVIISSYIFFFIAIRIWLFYILPSFRKKETSLSSSSPDMDVLPLPDITAGEGAGSGASIPSGGGGMFSGGGAGGDWKGGTVLVVNNVSADTSPASVAGVSTSGSSGDSFSLGDLDVDSAGALVIFLICIVIAAMLGGAVYVIYQAPVILSEAAFNAMLSGGMLRASKNMRGEDWTGSVFKATWIPFTIIAVITIASAAILAYVFPGETNIGDIVRHTLLK